MQGLLDHLCQQNKQIKIKLKISTIKTNFTNHNEQSIPGNCAKNLLGINSNAISVNVQSIPGNINPQGLMLSDLLQQS